MIYVIGSLRNPKIPTIAAELRRETWEEIFDNWYAAGPEADDYWQAYEKAKGHTFAEALASHEAQHVFAFDQTHLLRASGVVLVLPAGKSGHLELGWALGKGKKGYILLDGEPDRFDVMYNFADGVFTTVSELARQIRRDLSPRPAISFTGDTDLWRPEGRLGVRLAGRS